MLLLIFSARPDSGLEIWQRIHKFTHDNDGKCGQLLELYFLNGR